MTNPTRLSRRHVLVAGGLAAGGWAAGAWPGALAAMQHDVRAGVAFGTTVSIKAMHEDAGTLHHGLDAAWAEIAKVEKAASLFDAESTISRLNRDSRVSDAPDEFIAMLTAATEVSAMTRGAFDISVQPLWKVYATAFAAGRTPSDAEIAAVSGLIGYDNVEIAGTSVRLAKPGMGITLNGIAQGYATERCLKALAAHGIAHAFLNTGEIGIAGQRDGEGPWTAGIADPRREGELIALARPLSGVLATSGDYATAFTDDFKVHHILDPKTLRSPEAIASVSVLAQSGAYADALATAMMILPREESLELARGIAGVEVLIITKNGEISRTAGFPLV